MNRRTAFASAFGAILLAASTAQAAVKPASSPLQEKAFRHPDLKVSSSHQPLSELESSLATSLGHELSALGVPADHGFYDVRAGRWGSLILSEPLLPGFGTGNSLRWEDFGFVAQPSTKEIEREAWTAIQAFLRRTEAQLRVDVAELDQPRIGVYDDGALVQVSVGRAVGGVPVRNSRLNAVINHGNLVLLGLTHWGPVQASRWPSLSADEARGIAAQHSQPFEFQPAKGKPHLELILSRDGADAGDRHRLAWVLRGTVLGDLGRWEALVDATNGELLGFEDQNQYARRKPQVMGGVFPLSNDGQGPGGVEQPRWPMPFADLTSDGRTAFANSGGVGHCQSAFGSPVTTLSGRFVGINDTCGPISEPAVNDRLVLNLGAGPGTDCAVPAGHSDGDTHASRTTFYQVNRLVEQATGYLPGNVWLESQLPSNVNIVNSCNAFWNGGINFYRSNARCRNTGELSSLIAHEWGHGMDNNGVNANISNPGEGIADVHAMLRTQDSCISRGFFKNVDCGGYGDPCTSCSGVRDLDWAMHQSGLPHDLDWVKVNCASGSGPCDGGVHCEGAVVGETAWDLYARDFRDAPFSFDNNTALELTTRLFFLGSQVVANWFQCTPPAGGCNAAGGYLNVLAADDTDGNLANGTPHMTAIFAAFNRHQIACTTPAPVNSGCAGGPTGAPNVTAMPIDQGASLSWNAVPNATRYAVYRTEGVHGCDFGKARVGETSGTEFVDQGLRNGFGVFYTILPIGSNSSCFGRASACASVVPAAGANLLALENPAVQFVGGDGDDFLDNCETGRAAVKVENNGAVTLTNVRITSVTPLSHLGTIVTTPLPVVIAASLEACGAASGSFDFVPHGLGFDETTLLQVELTSDELAPQTRTTIVSVSHVESDFQPNTARVWSFEANLDGWHVTSGTFNRQPGGAEGTGFHVSSSECLDAQCDSIRTPLVRLQSGARLSLFHRYDTETPVPIPYDRANVGIVDVSAGTRTTVFPDGGKAYDLAPDSPNGACVTMNQAGWSADTDPDCQGPATFNRSTWSPAALNPGGAFTGRKAQLEIAYGTDPFANGYGFDFDQVRLTNFDLQVPDAQSCTVAPAKSRKR
jgi:trimeric autotransporter adhesin